MSHVGTSLMAQVDCLYLMEKYAEQEVKKAKIGILESLINHSLDSKFIISFSEKADGYNNAIENIVKWANNQLEITE